MEASSLPACQPGISAAWRGQGSSRPSEVESSHEQDVCKSWEDLVGIQPTW